MACVPALSNYVINKFLQVLTNQGTFTPPATLYVALYTSNPNPNNSGTEVSGTNYARQSVSWAALAGGTTANNNTTISFPAAGSIWGTVTYIALFDAVSGGNLIAFTLAASVINVNVGVVYTINPASLTLSFQ